MNIKLGSKNWERLTKEANKHQIIVRGWKANAKLEWQTAYSVGVNIIATDAIFDNNWAHVPSC